MVDHSAPLLDNAVDANGHAGTHGDQIAGLELGRGNAYLGIADDLLCLIGHVEQRVDKLVFAHGAGVVLEQLAHFEQEHRLPAVSTSRLTNEMPMAEASSTGTVRRGCASSRRAARKKVM